MLSDLAGADDFLVSINRLHRHDREFEFLSKLQEFLDASFPITPEVMVISLDNLAHPGSLYDVPKKKVARRLAGKLVRKFNCHEEINAKLLTQLLSLIQSRQQMDWSSAEHFFWVRLEGQDDASSATSLGALHDFADDLTMRKMHPVKRSDSYDRVLLVLNVMKPVDTIHDSLLGTWRTPV
jgi:hypothetical protein